jgi:hypothetical protein
MLNNCVVACTQRMLSPHGQRLPAVYAEEALSRSCMLSTRTWKNQSQLIIFNLLFKFT